MAKKCKNPNCKIEFIPVRTLQMVCSPKCAIEYAMIQAEKKKRKIAVEKNREIKKQKDAIKSRGDWLREAQAAFNTWIRLRDNDLPCISCGVVKASFDAGHYRARSVSPELRFNPENTHKQCVRCNQHLHGNLIEFRRGLIARIGADRVEWLEGKHDPAHYSIEDIKEIKIKYMSLAKELRKKIQ